MGRQATDYWRPGTRIVEVGVGTPDLAEALLRSGHLQYLGVACTKRKLQRILAACPRLARHVVVAPSRTTARNNNAELLVLGGTHCWHMARYRSVRHASYVAVPLRCRFHLAVAVLFGVIQCLLGRFAWPVVISCGEPEKEAPRLLVFRNRRPRPYRDARRFIPHRMGIEGFLNQLANKRVRYAVLRWFESLPTLPAGEDLDLLVEDAGLDVVGILLDAGPGVQPVDVYSVSGRPGSRYRGLPYFPPHLAQQLLDRACLQKDRFLVPCPRDHLRSLAFHAVYHKGFASGLRSTRDNRRRGTSRDHDYTAVLQSMAHAQRVDVAPTLEDVDRWLETQGWRPPRSMLIGLARKNRWLREALPRETPGDAFRGLAVFVLRGERLRQATVDKAVRSFENEGFHVLAARRIAPPLHKEAPIEMHAKRPGDGSWQSRLELCRSRSSYVDDQPCPKPFRNGTGTHLADRDGRSDNASDGPDAVAVVAYDADPLPMTWLQQVRHPRLNNARLLAIKKGCAVLNDYPSMERHRRMTHACTDGRRAMKLLQAVMPGSMDGVIRDIGALSATHRTNEPVLATLTRSGRRAKIEVLEQNGATVVRKTFKPHQLRYFRRELEALSELSKTVAEVPPVLHSDACSLTIPFYDNIRRYERSSGKLLPLPVAIAAMEALKKIYAAGWAHMDAGIDNVIIDRREGLKFVDFEFSRRYEARPASFEECFDIAGCPRDVACDVPKGGVKNYEQNWRPYVGLSLHSLLNDPRWLQNIKRSVYYFLHAPRFLPRRARFYFRTATALFKTAGRRKPRRAVPDTSAPYAEDKFDPGWRRAA